MSETKQILLVSVGLTVLLLAGVGVAIWWKGRQERRAAPAKPAIVEDKGDYVWRP